MYTVKWTFMFSGFLFSYRNITFSRYKNRRTTNVSTYVSIHFKVIQHENSDK